jgi:hypothetical protein
VVYYVLSMVWPATETFMKKAVLPDDVVQSGGSGSEEDIEKVQQG